jgi:hypothetical protein
MKQMKIILAVSALAVLAVLAWPGAKKPAPQAALPAALAQAAPALGGRGGEVLQFVDEELHALNATLPGLAEPGVYTVIAFTSEHCGMSKWLERNLTAFVQARRDVVVKSVRVFSGSVVFTSKQEQQAWEARRDGVRKRFNLDWGPKVYVYGPDGAPIIGERSKRDEGYLYLRRWIQAEVPGA